MDKKQKIQKLSKFSITTIACNILEKNDLRMVQSELALLL